MKKLVLACAALACTAALAQPDTPATQIREGEADQNQIVCRSETDIGSRVSRRRVCRTRAEWKQLQAASRDTVDRVQLYKPVVCDPIGAAARPC